MNPALKGIIICITILLIIFVIERIMTYPKRREKRFKRRTEQWHVNDRIILYTIDNDSGLVKPEDKIYNLVGWNINNFVICDIQNTLYTVSWLKAYKNVTAENRLLHNKCAIDMETEPGFKISDNETNQLRS